MKKNCLSILLVLAILFALGSCSCKHEWQNATCTTPVTCLKCGETAGDPLNHNWQNATCTAPVTCSKCGETAGDPLNHNWQEATCTTPQMCSVCETTEGTEIGHTWANATCTTPKTCSVCETTEGTEIGHTWANATCTTPKTCSVCGVTEGEEVGHTWTNATCTTPKTCSACGATEGGVGTHNWHNATCTKPKTCYTCWITEGSALGHNDDGSGWCTTCWTQLYIIEEKDEITASVTSLTISEPTTITIYTSFNGYNYYDITLNANYDSSIIEIEWGDWDSRTSPITIIPVQNGTATLRISYLENPSVYLDISVVVSMDGITGDILTDSTSDYTTDYTENDYYNLAYDAYDYVKTQVIYPHTISFTHAMAGFLSDGRPAVEFSYFHLNAYGKKEWEIKYYTYTKSGKISCFDHMNGFYEFNSSYYLDTDKFVH